MRAAAKEEVEEEEKEERRAVERTERREARCIVRAERGGGEWGEGQGGRVEGVYIYIYVVSGRGGGGWAGGRGFCLMRRRGGEMRPFSSFSPGGCIRRRAVRLARPPVFSAGDVQIRKYSQSLGVYLVSSLLSAVCLSVCGRQW